MNSRLAAAAIEPREVPPCGRVRAGLPALSIRHDAQKREQAPRTPNASRGTSCRIILVGLFFWFVSCTIPAEAAGTAFHKDKLKAMDAAINQAIAEKKCPGGVLWVEHKSTSYHKAYGHRALVPSVEPMTEDTIFDAASLTKVVACTPAMMLLIERGKAKLDETVRTYIPEFKGGGKETITVRQLMTHISGLRGDIETKTDWRGQQTAIQKACEEKLQGTPGTVLRYSDINFFLLGEIVQRV